MEILEYCESNYMPFNINSSNSIKLDEKIELKWNEAVHKKLFRYDLNLKSKILDGKQKYIIQLNSERLKEKRRPQSLSSMHTPFQKNEFNFNKIDSREILFNLKNKNSTADDKNLIAINVSPLEHCHILLIPQIDKCHPQVLSKEASKMAVDFLLLTTNKTWKVGFNSLFAFASVNHLHLHAWVIDHSLTIQNKVGSKLSDNLFLVDDGVTKAFSLHLDLQNRQKFINDVFLIANYLQENEVAHNIFWTRDSINNKDQQLIRAFIFPRKSVYGNQLESEEDIVMNVAVAELAGHIPIYAANVFDVLTEKDIDDVLSLQMLPSSVFDTLTDNILKLLAANYLN